jgi:hypothetical protein
LRGGFDDEAAEFLFDLRFESGGFGFGCLLSFSENILSLGNGLLGFFLREGGSALFGFIYKALGVLVGRFKESGLFLFAVSKLLLDLYEFGFTIGNAILPLFKDLLDRAKGKSLEDIQHQGKINYLCDEQRCFPAESPADLFCGVSEASGFCEKCEHVTWW